MFRLFILTLCVGGPFSKWQERNNLFQILNQYLSVYISISSPPPRGEEKDVESTSPFL